MSSNPTVSIADAEFATSRDLRFPSWTARAVERIQDAQAAEFTTVWVALLASSAEEQLGFLVDTREVHRRLFSRFAPPGFEVYAGHYRGEPVDVLEKRNAVIRYERPYAGSKGVVRFVPAQDVCDEMEVLKSRIMLLREARLQQVEYFFQSVAIFRRFSAIHPYLNGNGRISRLILAVLAIDGRHSG